MGERDEQKIFLNVDIPRIPDNMMVVRIHGKLAFIPKREEGEELFQRTPFTERQANALRALAFEFRQSKISERPDTPESLI